MLSCDAGALVAETALREELFGPAVVVVGVRDTGELRAALRVLGGNLTGTVHGDPSDDWTTTGLTTLAGQVGRLVYQGVPTGVAVVPAMHHGGPYPASSSARETSVGTDAIYRFLRPLAFQDFYQVSAGQGPDRRKRRPGPLIIRWRFVGGTGPWIAVIGRQQASSEGPSRHARRHRIVAACLNRSGSLGCQHRDKTAESIPSRFADGISQYLRSAESDAAREPGEGVGVADRTPAGRRNGSPASPTGAGADFRPVPCAAGCGTLRQVLGRSCTDGRRRCGAR